MKQKNRKCPFCMQCITSFNHVKKCKKIDKRLNINEVFIKYLSFNFPLLTRENLKIDYEKPMSLPDISKKYGGIDFKAICFVLDYFQIHRRSSSESAHLMTVPKGRKTNLERTGLPSNFCKNHPSRVAWEKRLFEEEGIINVFQRESVKDAIVNKLIEKYNVKHSYDLSHTGVQITKPQIKVACVVEEILSTSIIMEYKLKRAKASYYSYDMLVENSNKIIEVYGCYWHADPKIYKAEDIVRTFKHHKQVAAKEIWDHDKRKLDFAKENGYEVLVVWEDEIEKDIESIKKKIKEFFNGSDKNSFDKKAQSEV